MPFGRYRGEPLSALPDDYLDWLTSIDLRPRLQDAVYAEIRRREEADSAPATPRLLSCPDPAVAREIVGRGVRAMARWHHPDVGGTHEQMILVSAAGDWLRSLIARSAEVAG